MNVVPNLQQQVRHHIFASTLDSCYAGFSNAGTPHNHERNPQMTNENPAHRKSIRAAGITAFLSLALFTGACSAPADTTDDTADNEPSVSASSNSESNLSDTADSASEKASEKLDEIEDSADNADTENTESTENTGSTADYDRSAFPTWKDIDGDGCDVRQESLADHMENVELADDDCEVVYGEFYDYASGEEITFVDDGNGGGVDVDHLLPLGYAAEHGDAMAWSAEKRKQIANDPENLLPMDAGTNRSKQDNGPSGWMPADESYHCEYAEQFAAVADSYDITLPDEDVAAVENAC